MRDHTTIADDAEAGAPEIEITPAAFEARVLAGETISAKQIRLARGRLKGGSLKRSPADQPARRMAA